jgi:hypothetical protein
MNRLFLLFLILHYSIRGYTQNKSETDNFEIFSDTLMVNDMTIISQDTNIHYKEVVNLFRFYHLNYLNKDSIIVCFSKDALKEQSADRIPRGTLYYKGHKVLPLLMKIRRENANNFSADVAYNLFFNQQYKGITSIIRYHIVVENGKFKLDFDYSKGLQQYATQSKHVQYYSYTNVNAEKHISILDSSNTFLSNIFQINPIQFTYYDYQSIDELMSATGLIYFPFSNSWSKYGFPDEVNKKIFFSGKLDKGHELTHIYIREKFGTTPHSWFNEGFATLLFGSSGDDLEKDLALLKKDLEQHPEYNLNNLLEYSKMKMSMYTSYMYSIGALFCKLAYKKNGYKGIFNLLSYGSSDADFYSAIENELGVKQTNLNEYIRKELEKY